MQVDSLTENIISERLATRFPNNPINEFPDSYFDKTPKPAAIILPLLRKKNAWHLLFIRRTKNIGDRHSGQVAFPGGAVDSNDISLEFAALRETHEEVGILPQDIRILGRMRDLITISNFHLTPFVGVIPWPYPISPSPDEVERAFTIPLSWLADNKNRSIKHRDLPGGKEVLPIIYFNKFDGELLWGVSARITLNFLEVMRVGKPIK